MKSFIKSLVPRPIWSCLGRLRRKFISRNDASLTTQEVFSRIYEKKLWDGDGLYSSGTGSRDEPVVVGYCEAIKQWADKHDGKELRALDLGCGDFQVGRKIANFFKQYIAADIVSNLIEHHRLQEYELKNVTFACVDAIDDALPNADVVFVRQVLQHLSNDQIQKVIPKLRMFPHVIVTEHLPHESLLKEENLDKTQGGGIRLERGSGVYLEEGPFFIGVKGDVLIELPANGNNPKDGVIRTSYYNFTKKGV